MTDNSDNDDEFDLDELLGDERTWTLMPTVAVAADESDAGLVAAMDWLYDAIDASS